MNADELRAELDRLEERVDALEERLGIDESDSLDHTDPEDLRAAYDAADTITEAAERFDVGYGAVRRRLIEAGIHESASYDVDDDDERREDSPKSEPVDDVDEEPETITTFDVDAEDIQEADDVDDSPLAGEDSEHKYQSKRFRDWANAREKSDLRGLNVKVPDGVTSQDVYEAVQSGKCETIDDVCRFVGHSVDGNGRPRGAMRAILHHLGLYDELTAPEANRRRSS